MFDLDDLFSEEAYKSLEEKIEDLYTDAFNDIGVTIREYYASFAARDELMQKRLAAGDITEEYYRRWRMNNLGRGDRFRQMQNQVARRMNHANETATRYTNDAIVNVYTEARNYSAFRIEQSGANVNFILMNEDAVREALKDGAKTMPHYDETFPMAARRLLTNKDIAWGQKQIHQAAMQAIIQGKSISQIADDIQRRIVTMNRNSAIRAARTAVGSAQNAGHQAAYSAAAKQGLPSKKMWVALHDDHTRDSHAHLDGVTVGVDEEFPNGLMFPKDPAGEPSEVYNCRCREIRVLDIVADKMRYNDHTRESYDEWKREKEEATSFTFGENRGNIKNENTLKLDDIRVPKGVGAMGRKNIVMDLATGEEYIIVPGTYIKNVEVFAGKGTKTKYRDAYRYAKDFGGNEEDWQHVKGKALIQTDDGDFWAEIHWSQREGSDRLDMFIKRWLE